MDQDRDAAQRNSGGEAEGGKPRWCKSISGKKEDTRHANDEQRNCVRPSERSILTENTSDATVESTDQNIDAFEEWDMERRATPREDVGGMDRVTAKSVEERSNFPKEVTRQYTTRMKNTSCASSARRRGEKHGGVHRPKLNMAKKRRRAVRTTTRAV